MAHGDDVTWLKIGWWLVSTMYQQAATQPKTEIDSGGLTTMRLSSVIVALDIVFRLDKKRGSVCDSANRFYKKITVT